MLRDEMVAEISMRRDIPMETVEEVLEDRMKSLMRNVSAEKRKSASLAFVL